MSYRGQIENGIAEDRATLKREIEEAMKSTGWSLVMGLGSIVIANAEPLVALPFAASAGIIGGLAAREVLQVAVRSRSIAARETALAINDLQLDLQVRSQTQSQQSAEEG